jgi:hypothetical protein
VLHGKKLCPFSIEQCESTLMSHVQLRQLALPMPGKVIAVDLADIMKQPSGAAAIALCATRAGKLDKIIAADIGAQESVWSRIQTTGKGFSLEQLSLLMDTCGNEAPLEWLLLHRNYDPRSLRKLETDTEKKLREAEERVLQLEHDKRVLIDALRGSPA